MPDLTARMPHLDASVQHRLGTLSLDVKFKLRGPWTVMFGPSGAGKSTLLRILAGLVRPDSGVITLGGPNPVALAGAALFVAPGRRGIGFLTQSPNLFPHLDVRANIAFGLHRLPYEKRRAKTDEMLGLFHAVQLGGRMPASLSGGERQRVALARALAPEPRLLLLDEPFAALDAPLKSAILADLMPWLTDRAIPALYVSHDLAEAFQTGSEVISIHEGKIVAQGPPGDVLQEERKELLRQLGARD